MMKMRTFGVNPQICIYLLLLSFSLVHFTPSVIMAAEAEDGITGAGAFEATNSAGGGAGSGVGVQAASGAAGAADVGEEGLSAQTLALIAAATVAVGAAVSAATEDGAAVPAAHHELKPDGKPIL